MNDITKLIKRAALEAIKESDPMAIMVGTVLSIAPLQVNVEQRLTLGAAQLLLTNNVVDHDVSVTMDWSTEDITHNHGYSGVTGTSDLHTHSYSGATQDNTHGHAVTGTKIIKVHNALKAGDMVMLLRMQGGQKYLVIDKVVVA
jgi:hypothetical protein